VDEGKFNRLSLTDRANLVWQNGKFADSVIYNNHCLMLYSLNRQFVEMFIDGKSRSVIWVSLANDYDLAKYLRYVHIEDVITP
jgi:hypothetical protein